MRLPPFLDPSLHRGVLAGKPELGHQPLVHSARGMPLLARHPQIRGQPLVRRTRVLARHQGTGPDRPLPRRGRIIPRHVLDYRRTRNTKLPGYPRVIQSLSFQLPDTLLDTHRCRHSFPHRETERMVDQHSGIYQETNGTGALMSHRCLPPTLSKMNAITVQNKCRHRTALFDHKQQGRDRRRGAGQPRQPGLPRRGAEPVVGDRPDGVPHPRGQGLPVACDRLLRRDAGLLDDRNEPERRAGQPDAPRRVLHARRRGASDHPLGPRLPLPVARMDPHLRGAQADPVDEREGLLPGQRGRGGVLRASQAGVLSAGATSPASPSRGSSNNWTHT